MARTVTAEGFRFGRVASVVAWACACFIHARMCKCASVYVLFEEGRSVGEGKGGEGGGGVREGCLGRVDERARAVLG